MQNDDHIFDHFTAHSQTNLEKFFQFVLINGDFLFLNDELSDRERKKSYRKIAFLTISLFFGKRPFSREIKRS
jgi:hypothetical protein